jgi:hypothetical protein
MLDPATLIAIGHLAGVLGSGTAIAVTGVLVLPVAAATVVLTWHGMRGTNPGPAATQLLKLVELVVPRRRKNR